MAGSLKYMLARHMLRWRPATGMVLDLRVKKRWRRNNDPVGMGLPQHEYVVEIREDGQDAYSLKVEEPWGPAVDFVKAKIGDSLPLLVNKDRTDAIVDLGDPRYERERNDDRERQAEKAWNRKWKDKTRN